ncbi:hypothetical protein A2Y26_01325 [candidate division CPR2 bacterium GWD2_39_7]|nr:MAG: hypothetical protein A2Y27_03255 [candidate division CPR2 bacterium GWD1_39_7]OGB71643.1 MAG: hypothetical protein A2Y26_01325 [candidate division CPR2 bacterium GWD2_39_7]
MASNEQEFLWGVATSAHQIEGGDIPSDWYEFEKQGKAPDGSTTEKAVDGYNLAFEDIKLLKELGVNSYRFSIEWARVEPENNKFDEAALKHYHDLIVALKNNGITPVVTLHHFTNPKWIADKSSWTNKETANEFVEYARKIIDQNNNDVTYWITVNEPNVFLSYSYIFGNFPPYKKKDILVYKKAIENVFEAHRQIYRYIHEKNNKAQVSIAYNFSDFKPKTYRLIDVLSARICNYAYSWYWTDQVKNEMDFVGINYYFSRYVGLDYPFSSQYYKYTDVSEWNQWPQNIQPEGLEHITLMAHNRYKKPIIITENGLPDKDDDKRPDFIKNHIEALNTAKSKGVEINGYFYWSLMDNFEWWGGYKDKYGLYEVDYNTMKRRPRPSAFYYRDLIMNYQKNENLSLPTY